MSRKFNRRSVPVKDKCCQEEKKSCCDKRSDDEMLPIFYCARQVIPTQSLGVVNITRNDGSAQTLRHGDVIPDDINGVVAMDPVSCELKFLEGQIQQERLKEIIDDCIESGNFVTQQQLNEAIITMAAIELAINTALMNASYISQSDLDSAIAGINIPDPVTEQEIKSIFNQCLAVSGFVTVASACELIDQKIPEALEDLDLSVDPQEVNSYVQSYLNNIQFVTPSQLDALISAALSDFEPGVDEDAVKDIFTACIADLQLGISSGEAQTLVDSAIADLGGCISGVSTQLSGNTVTVTVSQDGCGSKSGSFDLPEGVVPRTDEEIQGVAQPLIDDAIAGLPPESVVLAGSMACSETGLVTTTLNQSNATDVTITADFSKFLGSDLVPRTDAEIEALAKPVAQSCVDAAIADLPTPATYCLNDLDLSISDGVITATIEQDNCESVSGSATLPEGSITNTVSGGTMVCDEVGLVTTTINQSGAAPAVITANFSKFFDNVTLTDEQVTTIVQPLIDAIPDPDPYCIQSHTFGLDNNVLTLTTVQENCADITASISLPEGAITSTVTALTQDCDEEGNLTTTITQSGAAAVDVTTDLSKFLDNITLTNAQVETIAKPVAQQCVQDAIDDLPDVGAQNTQDGSSLVCDEDGNLTLTIAQTTGSDVVVSEGIGDKLTSLESAEYQVINPNTTESELEITHTLSDGSTVEMSISGADLMAAISAFFTCETVQDPDAQCQEYTSFQIDGDELCKLKGYETPEEFCKTYCLSNIIGEQVGYTGLGEISLTTSSGGWSIIWPDGSTQSVDSGSTASYNFDGSLVDDEDNPLQVTICHDDPCAETSNFIISPVELKDSLMSKGCDC